jgi:hypothetical protein
MEDLSLREFRYAQGPKLLSKDWKIVPKAAETNKI